MQFGEKIERMFMKSTMIFPSKSIHREPGKRSEIVHSCVRTLQEKDFLLLLSLASIKNLLFNGRTRSCYKTYPAIYCNFLVSPWSLIIFHFLGKESLKEKGCSGSMSWSSQQFVQRVGAGARQEWGEQKDRVCWFYSFVKYSG